MPRVPVPTEGLVLVNGDPIPYRIVHSTRARRLRLTIADEAVVRIVLPNGEVPTDLAQLLQPFHGWILKHMARLEREARTAPLLQSGACLPYLGRELRLEVVESGGHPPLVSQVADYLYASVPGHGPQLLAALLEAWYREAAWTTLRSRADRWARTMRLTYGEMKLRDPRTRWASCSSTGNLSFSWRLVMAPLPVLDYVVIHELMHRREMNHGPKFWKGVGKYDPAYDEHRRWLRLHGGALSRVLPRSE